MASTQQYQEFASDFTGSVASLQQNTCDDFVADQIPVDVSCPTCTPDPNAIVPDWTTLTKTQPFLNGQTCQYSVVIDTKYTDVGGPDLVNRINEYAPVAARELLRYYNKLETDLIVDTLVNGYAGSGPPLQGTDWFVPFQQDAKLKILYTISAFNFDGISPDTEDPSAFNQEITPSANEVTLNLSKLSTKLDRVTQVFTVYSKYQAALRNIDNGGFIVENTNKEFVIGSINDETSVLYEFSIIERTINEILDDNGFDFFGTIQPQFRTLIGTRRRATSIKFGYAEKYVLDKITIVEEGCPDVVIEGNKLTRYSDESPLNNPTIIAYLSRIDEMYDEMLAIEAPKWTDILLEYTYPTLTINYGSNTLFDDQEALAECIASAIADYGSTILNRALDGLFSLPDIIAKKLNQYSCLSDEEIKQLENAELTYSQIIQKEGGAFAVKFTKAVRDSNVFKTFTIIQDFARRFKGKKLSLTKVFDDILDDYGFCGMLALVQSLFDCLASGFSFEELLRKIVESGLKGLTPVQVSKFLVLLPPDKQQEVISKVNEALKDNDLIDGAISAFNPSSQTLAEEQAKFDADKIAEEALVEKSKTLIKEAKTVINSTPNSGSTMYSTTVETYSSVVNSLNTEIKNIQTNQDILAINRDTIANVRSQLGTASLGDSLGKIQSIITKAYIDAFLELVDINELYAILTRFPGVKILAQLINATNCPTPEDNSKTTWLNFLNTLEIEWCKLHFDLALPPLPTLPDIGAFFGNLWKALGKAIKELLISLITKIVQEILSKILQILLNSLCDLLGTLTQAAAAALSGRNAGTVILDFLRESFGCPPLDNGEQEQALLEAVGQVFGGQTGQGSSAFTNEEVSSFLNTTAVSLTAFELVDLMKGKLSADKSKYLKSVYRATEPRFASIFPNESSIASLFSTLGNLIPDEILDDYEKKAAFLIDSEFPANTSVCGTPDSIDKFRQLREDILKGKGLSDDEIRHQIDGMQERMNNDMGFITDLASKGFGNTAAEKVATALYGPDVLENPMSALKTQQCETSVYQSPYSSPAVKGVQDVANSALFDGLKTTYLFDLFRKPTVFDTLGTGKKPVAFLNAVLSDKNARDFVKHNIRTDDLFFPLYNSEEQQKDSVIGSVFPIDNAQKNYFPLTVSKQTQDSLIAASVSASSDIVFSNKVDSYSSQDSNSAKRSVFGKKEDFSLKFDNTTLNKSYNLLYSQFVANNGTPSSENLSRLCVTTKYEITGASTVKDSSDTEIAGLTAQNEVSKSFDLIGNNLETFNTLYQSRFDLDEGIAALKQQYLPPVLINSPQADCFIPYMQNKINNTGESNSSVIADINMFNTISDKAMKFIISCFTEDEAYKFGYDYNSEKITQDDIDLDPDTLERKTNNPRVVFLDYQKYGGTEEQPPVYIKPPTRTGWLGVADTIIPELGCEPKAENIIDFDSLKSLMSDLQSSLSDDPKLMYSPDCREQIPYLKPLSAVMAANLQVAIVTTMRVYISEAILKCIPLYNKFVVSYDKIIDELYFDYIVKNIEDGLINQGEGIFEIKNDKYYLYFLEQCVQVISRKMVDENLTLTDLEQQALNSINDMINSFYFVTEKDYASYLSNYFTSILKDIGNFYFKLNNTVIYTAFPVEVETLYNSLLGNLQSQTTNYPSLQQPTNKLKYLFAMYKLAYTYYVVDYSNTVDKASATAEVADRYAELYESAVVVAEEANAALEAAEQEMQQAYNTWFDSVQELKDYTWKRYEQAQQDYQEAKTAQEAANNALNAAYTNSVAAAQQASDANSEYRSASANIYNAARDTGNVALFANTRIGDSIPSIDITKRNIINYLYTLVDLVNSVSISNISNGDNVMFQTVLNNYNKKFHLAPISLKQLRKEMVLEGIRSTKIQAKILMRKILKDEIATMSSNFAAHIYTNPSITNIRKYFLDTDTFLISTSGDSRYFDIPSAGTANNISNEQSEHFILERYVTIQNREIPIAGTTIPNEVLNRPSDIYGNISVTAFKDWISTLSSTTQNTDIYKLFGDLSVTGSSAEGFSLTGSTIGLKYGLRLSYVPSTLTPVPVASAEVDFVNDLLINFDPDSGANKYNHDCMVKALYDSDEFRFLFYYCFPLQKYMSAISVFITETFVKLIGVNDDWQSTPKVDFDKDKKLKFYKTKEACQIFFESFYNWDDTEYTNEKLKNSLGGTDSLIEEANALLRVKSPQIYTDWRIVPRKPFNEDGVDCDAAQEIK